MSAPIFNDDPQAIEKLEAKLARLTKKRDLYKAINAAIRKAKGNRDVALPALLKLGLSETAAGAMFLPDFAGRIGIPDYKLTNTGAEIRRITKRLEHLKAGVAA